MTNARAPAFPVAARNPSEGRECGACTACCLVLEIDDPELSKPAATLCPNCSNGCSIYEYRPRVCREWLCMWREFPGLFDENWRPDRSGVLIRMTEVDASGVEVPYFEVLEASKVNWVALAAAISPYLRAGDNVHFGLAARPGQPGRALPLRRGLACDADLPTIKAGVLDALRALQAMTAGRSLAPAGEIFPSSHCQQTE